MITDSIKTVLKNNPGVSALVADRLYPAVAKKSAVSPFIVYHLVNDERYYEVRGTNGSRSATIQIDCYGDTSDKARTVANAVLALLENFQGPLADRSIVQGTFVERDMDMPFVATGDQKGVTYRVLVQVRFEYHI